jgi:hypothetical protein
MPYYLGSENFEFLERRGQLINWATDRIFNSTYVPFLIFPKTLVKIDRCKFIKIYVDTIIPKKWINYSKKNRMNFSVKFIMKMYGIKVRKM